MEELKLIVETLNGLGDNTLTGFIWYLATNFADSALGTICFAGTITVLGVLGYKAGMWGLKTTAFGSEVGRLLGFTPPFTSSEKRRIISELISYIERENKWQ